jgi:hypothetical protein
MFKGNLEQTFVVGKIKFLKFKTTLQNGNCWESRGVRANDDILLIIFLFLYLQRR